MRLSGLKSRAHLIRKYSFLSCQAQSLLHALSRLYVQKGFALSDIHSVLWPTNTSGDRPLCVGSTPVSKGFANFSVFLFFNFSVLKQGVDPRVQRTHFSQHLVLYGAKSGALEYIGSLISPTLSNLAVTLIKRSWSCPISRSSDSTKFSSSCNQVRRQPFCHCTEAPSSGSSVQSVYRLGLL